MRGRGSPGPTFSWRQLSTSSGDIASQLASRALAPWSVPSVARSLWLLLLRRTYYGIHTNLRSKPLERAKPWTAFHVAQTISLYISTGRRSTSRELYLCKSQDCRARGSISFGGLWCLTSQTMAGFLSDQTIPACPSTAGLTAGLKVVVGVGHPPAISMPSSRVRAPALQGCQQVLRP